jgi:chorismate synthase
VLYWQLSHVFDKLEAELAKAMLSLPATKVRNVQHVLLVTVITGCMLPPQGLGNPVCDTPEAELAKAMLSLSATKVTVINL